MKRILAILAVLCLSVTLAEAGTVKKTFDIDEFTGISASDAFEVTLEHGDDFNVEVEVTEEFLPYLVVKNQRGTLELKFSKLPFKLKQKNRGKVAKAVVRLPRLTFIALSGASKLRSSDGFPLAMGRVVIDLTGASSISQLSLRAPEVGLKLSGASKANLELSVTDFSADISGASKLEAVGKASSAIFECSGASKVDADDLVCKEVTVNANGASNVEVHAISELTVSLSGASRCRYFGDADKLNVHPKSITGASSLKAENER